MSESREEIRERVIDLVADKMDVEPEKITDDTHFINDLTADSLDMAELVIDLEEEFDMTISDDEAQQIETVGDAVTFIDSNLED